jgi:hypothetical protein
MKYAHKQGEKKPQKPCSDFFTTICARCIIHSMKYANFEGGKKQKTCSTLVQNYVEDLLHVYLYHSSIFFTILFYFPCFITLAMKIKIS